MNRIDGGDFMKKQYPKRARWFTHQFEPNLRVRNGFHNKVGYWGSKKQKYKFKRKKAN